MAVWGNERSHMNNLLHKYVWFFCVFMCFVLLCNDTLKSVFQEFQVCTGEDGLMGVIFFCGGQQCKMDTKGEKEKSVISPNYLIIVPLTAHDCFI